MTTSTRTGITWLALLGLCALAAAPMQADAAQNEASATTAIATAPSPELAARAYERFTGLVGTWRAKSTKGWTSTATYRLLGRGTTVLSVSSFDDAPPERDMATAFHLDVDRLVLKHYCEAGNQPRLVATRIAEDLSEMEFQVLEDASLEGTNMTSREVGHMDRAIFRFGDEGHFTSQWTWYQDGKESWMEEITYVRSSQAESAAGR